MSWDTDDELEYIEHIGETLPKETRINYPTPVLLTSYLVGLDKRERLSGLDRAKIRRRALRYLKQRDPVEYELFIARAK